MFSSFFNKILGSSSENQTEANSAASLIRALKNRSIEVVLPLIEAMKETGAKLDAQNQHGDTALIVAILTMPNTDVVLPLIKAMKETGAKLDAQNQHGATALMLAFEHKADPKVTMALIQAMKETGAKFDAHRKDRDTALMLAIKNKSSNGVVLPLIEAMKEQGANFFALNVAGSSVFSLGFEGDIEKVLEALFKVGGLRFVVQEIDMSFDPKPSNQLCYQLALQSIVFSMLKRNESEAVIKKNWREELENFEVWDEASGQRTVPQGIRNDPLFCMAEKLKELCLYRAQNPEKMFPPPPPGMEEGVVVKKIPSHIWFSTFTRCDINSVLNKLPPNLRELSKLSRVCKSLYRAVFENKKGLLERHCRALIPVPFNTDTFTQYLDIRADVTLEASFAEHLHEYVLPRGLKDFLRAGPVLEYEPVVDRDPGLPLAGDASPGIGKLPEDVLVHITRFLC